MQSISSVCSNLKDKHRISQTMKTFRAHYIGARTGTNRRLRPARTDPRRPGEVMLQEVLDDLSHCDRTRLAGNRGAILWIFRLPCPPCSGRGTACCRPSESGEEQLRRFRIATCANCASR